MKAFQTEFGYSIPPTSAPAPSDIFSRLNQTFTRHLLKRAAVVAAIAASDVHRLEPPLPEAPQPLLGLTKYVFSRRQNLLLKVSQLQVPLYSFT